MTGKLEMNVRQRLALEKRMTYEAVDALRRRFGRMAGASMLQADEFNSLIELLESIKETISKVEVGDATNDAG